MRVVEVRDAYESFGERYSIHMEAQIGKSCRKKLFPYNQTMPASCDVNTLNRWVQFHGDM